MNKTLISFILEVDFYINNKKFKELNKVIPKIESYIKNTTLLKKESCQIFYTLGNAWYSLFTNSKKEKGENLIFSENDKLSQTIIYYRKAKQYLTDNLPKELICNLYTNLGNIFNEIGRPIEAFRNWNKALEQNNKFNMALGNFGYGLYRYANLLYDPSHKDIILREAYTLINRMNKEPYYEDAYRFFNSIKSKISNFYSVNYLKGSIEDKEAYSLGNNEAEINYKTWVLNHKLYLNPLNDLFTHTIVAHDILSLPPIRVLPSDLNNDNSIFHSLFNNIKQEFITLRYFYYLYPVFST